MNHAAGDIYISSSEPSYSVSIWRGDNNCGECLCGELSTGLPILEPSYADQDHDGENVCDDCDDHDARRHHGAVERCDEVDNNCDGELYPCDFDMDVGFSFGGGPGGDDNTGTGGGNGCPLGSSSDSCTDSNRNCNITTEHSANLATGQALIGPVTDFVLQGSFEPIRFERFYYNTWSLHKPLGYGWTHNFNTYLKEFDNNTVGIITPTGGALIFKRSYSTENKFYSSSGDSSYLACQTKVGTYDYCTSSNDTYLWKKYDGTEYTFAEYKNNQISAGKLNQIKYSSGQVLQFSYDGMQLIQITETMSGKHIDLSYDSGHITQIQIGSISFNYDYDNDENLHSVSNNGQIINSYLYGIIGEDYSYKHSMTAVLDSEGNFIEEIQYFTDNTVQYVFNVSKKYRIDYKNNSGLTEVTNIDTGEKNNIKYDPASLRLLSSDDCLGSCSSAKGAEYLYDSHNNRILSKNNDSIVISSFDQFNNLRTRENYSYLIRNKGSISLDFSKPEIFPLFFSSIPGQETKYEISNNILKIKASAVFLGNRRIDFASKNRISLKGNFQVILNYDLDPTKYTLTDGSHIALKLVSESSEDTWLRMFAGQESGGHRTYYADYSYSDKYKDVAVKIDPIRYWRNVNKGQLIINVIDGGTVSMSVLEGDTINPLYEINSSNCPKCKFKGPMYIEFSLYNPAWNTENSAGIVGIFVNSSESEYIEAAIAPNQPGKTYYYYTKDDGKLPPGTLIEERELSLKGSNYTRAIYDYDDDNNSNYNENPTDKLRRIVKIGWVDTNYDGILETEQKLYTCYEYNYFGKLSKEYQPSTSPTCAGAPHTAYGSVQGGYLIYKVEDESGIDLVTEYMEYDDLGNPTKIKDPNGVITEYTYDRLGRVTKQIVDGKYKTEYVYKNDNLLEVQNPSNSKIKYIYGVTDSPFKKLIGMERYASPSATDPIEKIRYQYAYPDIGNPFGKPLQTTTEYQTGDGLTNRKIMVEDGFMEYPTGSGIKRKYQKTTEGETGANQSQVINLNIFDDNGNVLAKIVNPGGAEEQTTKYDYNMLGQLVKTTDPLGNIVNYEYDLHGNLNRMIAEAESTQDASYYYDDFGRMTMSYTRDADLTAYQYDVRNNLTRKIDTRGTAGTIINYSYDNLNRLTKIDFPHDTDIEYFYDGNLFTLPPPYNTTITVPLANAKGRLTAVSITGVKDNLDPTPRYFLYEYDSRGSVKAQTMGVIAFEKTNIYRTEYDYDDDGNLSLIIYPDGRRVAYTPQTTDPDRIASVSTRVNEIDTNLASNISYYPFGDIKTLKYGNDIVLTNQLDKRYFPQNITATGVLNLSYSADSRGNITSITDGRISDRSQSFTYDLKDQLASAISTGTYGEFHWEYDPFGNRNSQTHKIQNTTETTNYFYRLTTNQLETDQLEQTVTQNPEHITTFSENIVSIIYRPGAKPHGKSLQEQWEDIIIEASQILDDADRGKSNRRYNNLVGKFNSFINHSQFDRKLIWQLFAHYPSLNNLIAQFLDRKNWNGPKIIEPLTWTPQMRNLARDIVYQASQITFAETEADDPLFTTNDYTYDAVGSLSEKHSYSDADPSGETTQYSNNDDSRLAGVTSNAAAFGSYVYDHLGQRVVKQDIDATIFIYDIFGNMIAEYKSDGTIYDYIYLGGRRIAKIEGTARFRFPGCGWVPPAPGGFCGISGLGQDVAFNYMLIAVGPFLIWVGFRYRKNRIALTCLFIVGAGIMIFMISSDANPQPPAPNPEVVYYFHNDHLGTPKAMTDSTGAVVWDAVYKPFGEIDSLSATVENNFRFPGQYQDELTELYYNHNRYYMPQLGRYNRVDPIYNCAKHPSPKVSLYDKNYLYARNNPNIVIDRNGLSSECYYCDIDFGACTTRAFISHTSCHATAVIAVSSCIPICEDICIWQGVAAPVCFAECGSFCVGLGAGTEYMCLLLIFYEFGECVADYVECLQLHNCYGNGRCE